MKYIPICVIIIKTHTNNTKEDSFLEIFKYWILSYLQVHVFMILLKVFKGGERKNIQHYKFRPILIYRANIGKRAILCQNIGIIGHFKKIGISQEIQGRLQACIEHLWDELGRRVRRRLILLNLLISFKGHSQMSGQTFHRHLSCV